MNLTKFNVPKEIPIVNPFEAKDPKTKLFTPLKIRNLTLKNRIFVSPMCQYSAVDGFMNSWHLAHLGQFAIRGAGLIIFEATGVLAVGRISVACTGLWKDEQIPYMKHIVDFVRSQGSASCLQLAHAGRKSSSLSPFATNGFHDRVASNQEGGWPDRVQGPSDLAFSDTSGHPKIMTCSDISVAIQGFKDAARRAHLAGFEAVEIHGAHGYLIHSFLSPLINNRTDEYGGSFENRTRLLVQVIKAVREVWPQEKPLFVRLSCTDFVPGGWDIKETVQLCKLFPSLGVDLVDCSSGSAVKEQPLYRHDPGWNTPYSAAIKEAVPNLLVNVVGGITNGLLAESILTSNKADVVSAARGFLANPSLVFDWASALNEQVVFPSQYGRAMLMLAKPKI